MAFDTIMAQDGCKTIGSDHSNQTYAFNPADISSVYAVVTTVDQTETTMWSSRLVDWDKFYALDCKSAQGRDYDPYDPIHFDPMNYDPCNPRIAIPPGFNTRIDPAWGACMTNRGFQGFYDPPFALDPTANLEVPDEAPYTTVAHDNITPSPPAAPQPVPDPGVKPTDYPKPSPADPKPAMPKGKNHPNPPTSTDGDDEASGDYDPTSDPKAKTKTQPQDPADIPPWTYPKDDSKSSPPKGEPQDDSSNYPPSSDPSNPSHSSNTPNPSNLSKTNPKYQPHNSDNNNDNNDDRKPYDPSKPDAPALSSIKGAFHPPSPTDSVQGPKSGEDAADPGYYIWSGIGGTPNRGGTQTNTVVGALPSVVNSPGGDSGSGDDRTNSGMGNGTTGGDGNTVIWSSGARRRGGDVWLSWIYRIIVGMVVLWV